MVDGIDLNVLIALFVMVYSFIGVVLEIFRQYTKRSRGLCNLNVLVFMTPLTNL